MNWYKNIIYSSWNLKIPEEIYPQIEETTNLIIDTLNGLTELPKSPIFIKQINFSNKYEENSSSYSNIYLNNKFVDDTDIPAMRDKETGNIYINIYKIFFSSQKATIDINYFKELLKNHLIHELSHSIDPKIVNLNKNYNIEEYLKPTEFDAYSNEITSYIRNAYQNDNNKEILKQWITSSGFGEIYDDINRVLSMPYNNFRVIQFWKSNKPEYIRKLRQRLYNEVLNESNS